MVLHYISNDAKFIEISTATFCAKGLFERDLHVGDMLTTPRCAEEGIGKSQNEEILHHFFPEVMVDTESLRINVITSLRVGGDLIFTPDWSEGFLESA